MKILDLQYGLLISIGGFNFPSSEIEVDDFFYRKCSLVVEIGQERTHRSVGRHQSDHSEFEGFDGGPVFARYLVQVVGGWGNPHGRLGFAAPEELLHCGKRQLGRTTKDEEAFHLLQDAGDQFETRVAAIKQDDAVRGEEMEQFFGLCAFTRVNGDNGSCYGQTSEDIVQRRDKAHGIVAFAWVLESAVRIKFVSDLLTGWEGVLGAVYGEDGHAMPEKLLGRRPAFIGQTYRPIKDVSEDFPPDFPSSLCERAAMDRFAIRPKAALSGLSEEQPRFHIHPHAFPAPNQSENKGDQFRKWEFSFTGEIFGELLCGGVDLTGDDSSKFSCKACKLA